MAAAKPNPGGPQAQASARTIFPNTGGTIIGGVGGNVSVADKRPLPKRTLPVDAISEAFAAKVDLSRIPAERVQKMRDGQAKLVAAFKQSQAPTKPE